MEISEKLLKKFKLSVGDLQNDSVVENSYYKQFIEMAIADLSTDDISEDVLNSDIGHSTIIIYATELMNGKDISTNPTISLLRNKLSIITKGDRDSKENGYKL